MFPIEKCIMVFRSCINSSQSADLNVRIMYEVNGKNTKLVLGTHFLNRTQIWLSIKTSLYSYIHSFFVSLFCIAEMGTTL